MSSPPSSPPNDTEWEWEMIPPQSSSISSSLPSTPLPPPRTVPPASIIHSSQQENDTEPEGTSSSHSTSTVIQSSISQRNPHSYSQASSSSTSISFNHQPPENQMNIPFSSSSVSPTSSIASSAYSSSSSPEEKLCRICQSEDDAATMISPCKCRGSMKYVHVECLDKWRKTSANPRSFFQCEQCLFKYQFSRTHVANALASPLTKHALTIVLLFLLITLSGYLGKLFSMQSWFMDSLPDIEVDEDGNIIPRNSSTAAVPLSTVGRMWEFLRIDIAHLLLGSVLVGLGGFFSLFFTARLVGGGGGGFYWSTSSNSSSSGGRSSAEAIVLAVIVLIGLARSGYLIYRWVEERSERMLLTAKDMVVNIQADSAFPERQSMR